MEHDDDLERKIDAIYRRHGVSRDQQSEIQSLVARHCQAEVSARMGTMRDRAANELRDSAMRNLRNYQWLATPHDTWTIPGHDWQDRLKYYKRRFKEDIQGTESLILEGSKQPMANSTVPGSGLSNHSIDDAADDESASPPTTGDNSGHTSATEEHDSTEQAVTIEESQASENNFDTPSTSEDEEAGLLDPRTALRTFRCQSPPDGLCVPFPSPCPTPGRSNSAMTNSHAHHAPMYQVPPLSWYEESDEECSLEEQSTTNDTESETSDTSQQEAESHPRILFQYRTTCSRCLIGPPHPDVPYYYILGSADCILHGPHRIPSRSLRFRGRPPISRRWSAPRNV
ncbi:hypothetical protein PFICI_14114 [Pestalotiopsis fici W106-1]|uniref:Uncharacterized protein n=1 Tax=Pestalotiopsis fici (strain W106-1 / CGMCC3.15140) TaxID=1229662 RepID=W3WK78_PESFW|nr:uncharacterized protein PFICI_14114 [Pestalotiopsis fici W106-1]ETS74248.1 hypothetical protein PFICI_14114 [Pestalotiopsis fici W106-1]